MARRPREKRDLTGRRAGKPSRAELRAAAQAISINDKKAAILEIAANMEKYRGEQRAIGAKILAERKRIPALGLTLPGFDFSLKLLEMDPEVREDTLFTLGLTMETKGRPIQDDLFKSTEQMDAERKAQNGGGHIKTADHEGYEAAKDGKFASSNPYADETPEHEAWNKGWMRWQAEKADEMAPQPAAEEGEQHGKSSPRHQ